MDFFKTIDIRLSNFADNYCAEIHTSGTEALGIPKEKIVERRIIWATNMIWKAVVIVPCFSSRNIDNPNWDFVNAAWVQDGDIYIKKQKPIYIYLLRSAKLSEVISQIDLLLATSSRNLDPITLEMLEVS